MQHSSNNDSEFVENTLVHVDSESNLKNSESVPSKPVVAQKDIDSLKKSWAYMADFDPTIVPQNRSIAAASSSDSTQSPDDNLNLLDDDGFQQVISKGTKKARQSAQLKKTYITRSKVGSKSPSQ